MIDETEAGLVHMQPRRRLLRVWHFLLAGLAVCSLAFADGVTFSGEIIQPAANPAVNNSDLNKIQLGDLYGVTLAFKGSINVPGTYSTTASTLTGASLMFSDLTNPANETSFGDISLTITANGAFDDISLLGCLTTGSGCGVGNQLDANFEILAASLNSQSVPAVGLDQPHPLDLLEDDGSTDIQGTITSYSYTSVPEPSSPGLIVCLAVLFAAGRALMNGKLKIDIP
jgi:hypothetical protein